MTVPYNPNMGVQQQKLTTSPQELANQEIQSILGQSIEAFTASGQDWNSQAGQNLHQQAEAIRAKYGFSGGASGAEYIPINNKPAQGFNFGTEIPGYTSAYKPQMENIESQIMNIQPYQSPYANSMNNIVSQLIGRQFNYNPQTDTAFQQASKELGRNTMEQMNERGILNSTVTENQVQQGIANMMPQYEEKAYNRFQQETDNLYKMANFLQALDTQAYNQYKNQNDRLFDIADFIGKLDDKSFDQYKTAVDMYYNERDYNYKVRQDQIAKKQKDIENAWERTRELGYVGNDSSIILGIPVGTRTYQAQQDVVRRQQELEDYDRKLKDDIAKDNRNFDQQKQLLAIQENYRKEAAKMPAADQKLVQNMGTQNQVSSYYTLKSIYLGGTKNSKYKDDPKAAYDWLAEHPKENIELVGEKLYNQLLNDVVNYSKDSNTLVKKNQADVENQSDVDNQAFAEALAQSKAGTLSEWFTQNKDGLAKDVSPSAFSRIAKLIEESQ